MNELHIFGIWSCQIVRRITEGSQNQKGRLHYSKSLAAWLVYLILVQLNTESFTLKDIPRKSRTTTHTHTHTCTSIFLGFMIWLKQGLKTQNPK